MHKKLHAAYSYYNVIAPGADIELQTLMLDELILAKLVRVRHCIITRDDVTM